jgi:hypothetical protein
MGLKGYRLWVMGQLDSNVQSPTAAPAPRAPRRHGVAVQVAFLKGKGLKPVFHFDRFKG